MQVKELPRIEYQNEMWTVDGQIGELRNDVTLESIKFEDIEDMVLLDRMLSREDIKEQVMRHMW